VPRTPTGAARPEFWTPERRQAAAERYRAGAAAKEAQAGAPAPPQRTPQPKVRPPGDPGPTPPAPDTSSAPRVAATAIGPNPWSDFWTDKRASLALGGMRNELANMTGDPRLKPNQFTVTFWGPLLGRCLRNVPLSDEAEGAAGFIASRWVWLGIGAVLIFVLVLPFALSVQRRRRDGAGQPDQGDDAPANVRLVGSGTL